MRGWLRLQPAGGVDADGLPDLRDLRGRMQFMQLIDHELREKRINCAAFLAKLASVPAGHEGQKPLVLQECYKFLLTAVRTSKPSKAMR